MFTESEVKNLIDLYTKLEERTLYICHNLIGAKYDVCLVGVCLKNETIDYEYRNNYGSISIDTFPIKYLTMTDEEIKDNIQKLQKAFFDYTNLEN